VIFDLNEGCRVNKEWYNIRFKQERKLKLQFSSAVCGKKQYLKISISRSRPGLIRINHRGKAKRIWVKFFPGACRFISKLY
jgi:hypothetical protein